MAKRIKKGVGMTERVVIQRDESDFLNSESFASAFFEALEANCIAKNVRAENAKRARKILAEAGPEQGNIEASLCLGGYSEDKAESLVAEWLRTFHHIESLKVKAASGDTLAVSDLIDEAEHLGVIQERLWWRCGLDYSTGEKRETLAISGREYKRRSDEGAEKRRGEIAPHTSDVPSTMRRLVEAGHSISNAARIAAKNGIGKSEKANRAIWYRRK